MRFGDAYMNKVAIFTLPFVFVLVFCACNNNQNLGNYTVSNNETASLGIGSAEMDAYFNTFENFEYTFDKISTQDNNYVIKESDQHAGNFYEIYDNDNKLLDKGYHGYSGSFNISKKDNIVILEYGCSGTFVFPNYRFYDVEKSRISPYFNGPIATKDNLVAYCVENNDKSILVVQDIFDVDKFYKEFSAEYDKSVYMGISKVSFSQDATDIILEFLKFGDDLKKEERTFKIYK